MDLIDEAFSEVERVLFLPPLQRQNADLDVALPIGHGQTMSQPYTVRLMFDLLKPKPDQKILDVGSGTGWTTALLSKIVGPNGYIYAVERIPKLVKFGRRNCEKVGCKNVEFHLARKEIGLKENAPYDRILVSASAQKLPEELLDQLKDGGKIVIPVQESILEITKNSDDSYEINEHPGFVFVPLM